MSTDDHVQGITDMQDLDVEKARQLDKDLDGDRARQLAVTKLLNRIGSSISEDVGIVEAAYRTIAVIDDHERRLTRIEDQLDKIDRDAGAAIAMAETNVRPGDQPSKQDVASIKSRNEALRRLADGEVGYSGMPKLTVSEVQEMARPETVLHYQTVKDAWAELVSQWDAFEVGENEDDERVLAVDRASLDPAVVKAVERDLDRDDLAKRLLSGGTEVEG